MTETGTLSRKQKRFVVVLATSSSVREAAELAGIGERTAWRWLNDRVVRAAANEALTAVLAAATHEAASRMTDALKTLADVMGDPGASASARVSAARAILDTGLRYHERLTLAERVAALEEELALLEKAEAT